MLDLEAVCLVLFIVERIQFIDGDLVEAVEIRPPFPAGAKVIVQVSIGTLLAQFGSHIECAHSQNVDTVTGNGTECSGNRFHNTCVNAGALGSCDVNTHTGTTEDHSAVKFLLGDHGTNAQANAVEHQFGIVGVGVSLHTDIGNGPALLLQLLLDCFLQRIAGKVSRHQQFLIGNSFHTYKFLPVYY